MPIEVAVFRNDLAPTDEHRPLLIGCSGGGGHNAAIEAIRQYFEAEQKKAILKVKLPLYKAQVHADKPKSNMQKKKIRLGQKFMHGFMGKQIKKVLKKSPFPILPMKNELDEEVSKIDSSQKNFFNLSIMPEDKYHTKPKERMIEIEITEEGIQYRVSGMDKIGMIEWEKFPIDFPRPSTAEEVIKEKDKWFPEIFKITSEAGHTVSVPWERKERPYIDMLLDVYPAGYENAAIWNVLQKADKTEELKKLIALQKSSDDDNYDVVKKDMLERLIKAFNDGIPYTEVISTQAMALPALCDAVKEYNFYVREYNYKISPVVLIPEIKIHQYMTDLPTTGAVHFFNSLKALKPEQQEQMCLYGVNLDQSVLNHFQLSSNSFAGIFSIDPTNNPMVRKGFKNNALLAQYTDFSKEHLIKIQVAGGEELLQKINPDEKIASVMLGSQASTDTIDYVKELVTKGFKVFVFGGQDERIKKGLDKIAPQYQHLIVRLGNQDDAHIAPIMCRSEVVVMRGGGLSVMEQLAMPHNEKQTILVHTKNERGKLTSGISWEDENVNLMQKDLRQRYHIHIERTTVQKIEKQIQQSPKEVFNILKQGDENKKKNILEQIKNSKKMHRAVGFLIKKEAANEDKWAKEVSKNLESIEKDEKNFRINECKLMDDVIKKLNTTRMSKKDKKFVNNLKTMLLDYKEGLFDRNELHNKIIKIRKDYQDQQSIFSRFKSPAVKNLLSLCENGIKKIVHNYDHNKKLSSSNIKAS